MARENVEKDSFFVKKADDFAIFSKDFPGILCVFPYTLSRFYDIITT